MFYEVLPKIQHHLRECQNIQDLSDITICLQQYRSLITEEIFQMYHDVVDRIVIPENQCENSNQALLTVRACEHSSLST